ncbi:MAG: GntP family permease, partial [Ignavibacteria bacterium]|nr:GntP family permease [Ignavibacteria bacterium]
MPTDKVIQSLKEGLGNTLASIGLVIVFGTALGIMLEKTGAAYSMAEYILQKVGKHNAQIAMTITGYVFGIPIFCDSGIVVLSSLNKSLAAKTKRSMTVMGSLLGVSLYSVHCLIPPHLGATAAAGIIDASIGKLMLIGLAIALITLTATFFWIKFIGSNYESINNSTEENISENNFSSLPKPFLSFLPVFLPIILIAIKSVLMMYKGSVEENLLSAILFFIGDPSIALLLGLAATFFINPNSKNLLIKDVIEESIKAAGVILLITGAGGAFGSVLKATGIGSVIGEYLSYSGLGIFIPFL